MPRGPKTTRHFVNLSLHRTDFIPTKEGPAGHLAEYREPLGHSISRLWSGYRMGQG
jgi:hypothetical protein